MSLGGRNLPRDPEVDCTGRFGKHERASKLRFRISLTRTGTRHVEYYPLGASYCATDTDPAVEKLPLFLFNCCIPMILFIILETSRS